MERQSGFDDPGGTGGVFGVAHLTFDAAQGNQFFPLVFTQKLSQGGGLGGISSFSAGAVGFPEANGHRVHPGVFVGPFQGQELAFGPGSVDGFKSAVRSGAHPFD